VQTGEAHTHKEAEQRQPEQPPPLCIMRCPPVHLCKPPPVFGLHLP